MNGVQIDDAILEMPERMSTTVAGADGRDGTAGHPAVPRRWCEESAGWHYFVRYDPVFPVGQDNSPQEQAFGGRQTMLPVLSVLHPTAEPT
jgi:hypothetical protein